MKKELKRNVDDTAYWYPSPSFDDPQFIRVIYGKQVKIVNASLENYLGGWWDYAVIMIESPFYKGFANEHELGDNPPSVMLTL